MELLFTVVDTFSIDGRGIVLTPGISYKAYTKFTISKGAPLRLLKPDLSTFDTEIRDLERLSYRTFKPIEEREIPILLPKEIRKDDIPIGTKVYLLLEPNIGLYIS